MQTGWCRFTYRSLTAKNGRNKNERKKNRNLKPANFKMATGKEYEANKKYT